MSLAPFKPFDTVLTETPSLVAISLIVAMGKILSLVKTVDFFILYKENKKLTSRHTKIFETFERFRCKNKQKRYSKNGKYGKNAVKSCKFVDKKRFQ
jgi:hypothetical protein